MNELGLLFSGGIESTVIAYWKRPSHAFTINYGQVSSEGEIRASRQICDELKIHHHIVNVDCRSLGSGDLAGNTPSTLAAATEWWPFRNQLIVTLAGMKCIALGVEELMIGTVVTDGIHKDGTPEFVDAMNHLMMIQEGHIKITAPGLAMTTIEMINESKIPIELLAWTHSCHTGNFACGLCRGCQKRQRLLQEVGLIEE